MTLLKVSNLGVHYAGARGSTVRAVDDVSLHVNAGETVGLVGESGCGKSTLARNVMRLARPTQGKIEFDGQEIGQMSERALRPFRRRMQMVFQDPFASLNPRHTVRDILTTPLKVHGVAKGAERHRTVERVAESVGLARNALDRYPHEFSGGQRQRIGIARALILRPDLIVCDEPVSALDLSIQAQILNLLSDMKRQFGLSYLFISHDLSVINYFADRVLVMYLGRIVESASVHALWAGPKHPYTQALIAAIPGIARSREPRPIQGDLPVAGDKLMGCRFHPRCSRATDICRHVEPLLAKFTTEGHEVACHHAN